MVIRIGTRGSKLALVQTATVCKKLSALGIGAEQVIIKTEGDATTGVPLHEIGGQGVFVRALDDAILAGDIDCAVHSMKDIPAFRPSGLVTAAVLKRDSAADYLAYKGSLDAVKVVGTSSTRRRAQLLRHDPDISIQDLRGNVDTRIRKMTAGEFDAILLAEAGLTRLGIRIPGERLPPEKFVPAPNQGTIAVVSRADPCLMEGLSTLDHSPTRTDVAIGRAVMEQLGGGCFTPLGIYCHDGHLIAEVLSLDGARTERLEANVQSIE
ncbi:MAG TPA: hydroxymethylbilane synthase, partial [Methanoregula sp.]|nr:hydroxymethylbilane synthase [Methanoregula sp.]